MMGDIFGEFWLRGLNTSPAISELQREIQCFVSGCHVQGAKALNLLNQSSPQYGLIGSIVVSQDVF